MPDATPAQIRAAVGAFIGSKIPSLNIYVDTETEITAPAAVILQQPGKYLSYQVALGQQSDAYDSSLRVILFMSKADVQASTVVMDNYLGADGALSVVAALATDPTIGGVCDYCVPVESSWIGSASWAGQEYLAAQILLDIGAE